MIPPLNLLPPEFRAQAERTPTRTIVGVIADMKDNAVSQPTAPTVYAPLLQGIRDGYSAAVTSMRFAVRTKGDPLALLAAVRDQIRSLLPDQPIAAVATMDQLVDRSFSGTRFSMLLFNIFAGLALVLSAIGVYGVMAYTVTQRNHEIGIRMSLGAQPGQVLRLFLRQGAKLAVVGTALGVATALGLTRLMASLLYGVSPTDPLTFAAVAILIMAVALLACYIPAQRAMRVDPMVALRHE
jgi:putative ABC transport system permease protein